MKNLPSNLQRPPTKWALAAVVLLVAYGLLQPLANSRLGLSLPSLTALIGNDSSVSGGNSGDTPGADARDRLPAGAGVARGTPASASTTSSSTPSNFGGPNTETGSSFSADTTEQAHPNDTESRETQTVGTFGYLRKIGNDDFLSPGGLRFTRGSQEGHRLKHLARHLEDQPDRPGYHGVFRGDMPQVLKWLDEAYQRAEKGQSGTSQRVDDGRTIHEAEFPEPIGFVGGREGGRRGNPPAKNLRLVTEGNRVITAFPF